MANMFIIYVVANKSSFRTPNVGYISTATTIKSGENPTISFVKTENIQKEKSLIVRFFSKRRCQELVQAIRNQALANWSNFSLTMSIEELEFSDELIAKSVNNPFTWS